MVRMTTFTADYEGILQPSEEVMVLLHGRQCRCFRACWLPAYCRSEALLRHDLRVLLCVLHVPAERGALPTATAKASKIHPAVSHGCVRRLVQQRLLRRCVELMSLKGVHGTDASRRRAGERGFFHCDSAHVYLRGYCRCVVIGRWRSCAGQPVALIPSCLR